MAKDPAFLFYPNDWLGGTIGMTFEEKGAYMDLLMMQFNRGRLQEHIIIRIISNKLWDTIKLKFKKDATGLWFNERLELEQNKREEYSESRRKNRSQPANLKPNESDSNKTNIYIIKDKDTNNIKIEASINPKNRLSTLKYKTNKDLVLSAVFKNLTLKDEKDIHKHFIEHNVNGDWFELKESDVIEYISSTYDKHMSLHMEDENEDENISINKDENSWEIFRANYPGTKRGTNVELDNLKRKHKDWKEVIPILSDALSYQISARASKSSNGGFVPEWKMLQTWINQRCWEEEISTETNNNKNKRRNGTVSKNIKKRTQESSGFVRSRN